MKRRVLTLLSSLGHLFSLFPSAVSQGSTGENLIYKMPNIQDIPNIQDVKKEDSESVSGQRCMLQGKGFCRFRA